MPRNLSRLLLAATVGLLLASCVHQPIARVPAPRTAPSSLTGIAACDSYLATYVACHRAAAIFPADQLTARYQTMRDSLLRDAQNSATRPEMAQRCTVLTTQLQQALHGKSCASVSALPSH